MDEKNKTSSRTRDLLANERTFLAWIRTSIGLMAFGFVVERFSIFMKQITYYIVKEHLTENFPSGGNKGYSSHFGILLVALGALISVISFIQYKRSEKRIEQQNYRSPSFLATGVTFLVLISGFILVFYLFNF